jgi:hypothetical protein
MRIIGIILTLLGIALCIYALTMDTSVRVDYPMGNFFGLPERVNNLGLMNDKQNYLIVSGVISIIGVIFIVMKKNKSKEMNNNNNSFVNNSDETLTIKSKKTAIQEWKEKNPGRTLNDFYSNHPNETATTIKKSAIQEWKERNPGRPLNDFYNEKNKSD